MGLVDGTFLTKVPFFPCNLCDLLLGGTIDLCCFFVFLCVCFFTTLFIYIRRKHENKSEQVTYNYSPFNIFNEVIPLYLCKSSLPNCRFDVCFNAYCWFIDASFNAYC